MGVFPIKSWAQLDEENDALRARIDELSRAYAVQGLAIEELTAERDALCARVAELEAASRDALLAASESRCDQVEIILAAALR